MTALFGVQRVVQPDADEFSGAGQRQGGGHLFERAPGLFRRTFCRPGDDAEALRSRRDELVQRLRQCTVTGRKIDDRLTVHHAEARDAVRFEHHQFHWVALCLSGVDRASVLGETARVR